MSSRRRQGVLASAILAVALPSPLGDALRAAPIVCWPPPVALDFTSVAPLEPACPAADLAARPADGLETLGVLGEKVRGPADEDLGQIIDVVVDRGGRPVAAVIDFGGFLGVGSRKLAVDWRALSFNPTGEPHVRLALGHAEIQAAPEYKRGAPIAGLLGRAPTPPVEPPPPVESPPDKAEAPAPSAPASPPAPPAPAPAGQE